MKDGRTVMVSAEDTWSSSDCFSGTSVLHDGQKLNPICLCRYREVSLFVLPI